MGRFFSAVREWMQLRIRVVEERRFHIDCAAAELRDLGLSAREANRRARARFGSRQNSAAALRELGADLRGLAFLLRGYRAFSLPWLQPVVLIGAIALMLGISPAPREIVEGVIGQPLKAADRETVFLSTQGLSPLYAGIPPEEFDTLRTLSTLTDVKRFRTVYVCGRAAHGVTLAAIQAEARARTGNKRFWAGWLFDQTGIETAPAKVIWIVAMLSCLVALARVTQFGKRRWLVFGVASISLHALASLTAWAFAMQIWTRTMRPVGMAELSFWALLLAYFSVTLLQYRGWWRDLNQRCPICLNRLLLSVTNGRVDRMLLDSCITESICAHGHGVLVETPWFQGFRPEESGLEWLVGA